MKTFFDYDDYKKLVLARVSSMPKEGRGEFQRIAAHLKMHTTRVSHVFKGSENLTLEQATSLADYLGFNELETEYFLNLVNLERAGTQPLKRFFQKQRSRIRDQSKELFHRLPKDQVLSDEQKAMFYSNWFYSGIRLLSSIEGFHDVDRIAERLELPKNLVRKVMDFLLKCGLCIEKNGKFTMGPKQTHLEAESPMVMRLHANWRIMAITKHPKISPDELALTMPMSLNLSDIPLIRKRLVEVIEEIRKIPAAADKPDQLACVNIDLFKF